MRILTVRSLFFALFLLAMQAPTALAGPTSSCGKYESWVDVTVKNPDGSQFPAFTCAKNAWFVRHVEGGGWKSSITFYNPIQGSKSIFLYLEFLSTDGSPIAVNVEWMGFHFSSQTSRKVLLLQGYNNINLSYESSSWQAGPVKMRILYNGQDAEAVLDQVKSSYGQLTYEYTPPSGVTMWQVPVSMFMENEGAPSWNCSFTETPLSMDRVSPSVTALSVLNISDLKQDVQISLYSTTLVQFPPPVIDQFTIDTVPKYGTGDGVMANFLHRDIASFANGKVVYGQMTIKGSGGGNILPLSLRAIGNSLSSNVCFPQQ